MALTYRFYRSLEIGDGLTPATAFRSALTRYITSNGVTDFWDWKHEARSIRYAFARCDSTVHALCAADPDITPYSPELADIPAMQSWLNGTLASVSVAIKNQIESDGFSTAWANAQTTRRAAFIYISRVHVMMQECRRLHDIDSLVMFTKVLDSTIGQLSIQVRNKVAAWMTNRGLQTDWIIGSTTVRQVIQYIISNLDW
jgi:hypothetical protein